MIGTPKTSSVEVEFKVNYLDQQSSMTGTLPLDLYYEFVLCMMNYLA